jgi:SAM-dependent methyltransferase
VTDEQRRRSFENTTEIYDRFRPSYPAQLFEDVRAHANLEPDDRILEVGCGTGRATAFFAAWGNPLLATDAAPTMAERTRTNLEGFANVEVVAKRFEEIEGRFGLVTCAQVYHWLDHETRVQRFHDLLRPGGTAAIIANVQVVPEYNRPFWVRVNDVYREITPGMEHQGDFDTPDNLPSHPFDGSPLFERLTTSEHFWEWTLDTETYAGLLATHSNKAALDPDTRARLIGGISELVDAEFGGQVTECYVAMAWLASRPADR